MTDFVVFIGLPSGGVQGAVYTADSANEALAQHGRAYGKVLGVVEKGGTLPESVTEHGNAGGIGNYVGQRFVDMGWCNG